MAWLGEQGFETPFLDFDKHGGIPLGADWEKTLYREIERAEAIVIIQTPDWLDSKWCFAEFTQARALGKAIFPIIETPTGDTLISPDIQALDLIKDREGGLEQLCSQLTRIALDAQGGFDWDSSRPPYPGLLAFQEEDAALYFGRDDDIRRLIERLDARRAQGGRKLIALLGASGSGKSSLLRAGVIPRLKRAGNNWIVLPTMRPQVRPVDELARSLAVACAGDADWRSLRAELNGDNLASSLSDIANDLRMQASANEAQILLPIDQGEELFGAADPEQARRFCQILSLALSSELPLIAVMALRSDYLGLLQSAEHLGARFEEFSLGPMPLDRIAQIIEGPARVAGLGIDEAFVHQAVRDAKTEDALPLLAFALRELYDRAADGKHLSLAEYNALGDAREDLTPLENAVRKAADNVLTETRPDEKELTALREAFVPAMVRVNEQGEYVRRPARWDELPNKAHSLLERLAKARLLIISQDDDNRMVEVAHEALLRKWPRLRSWLDDAREFLAGKQQLERDLHDWEHAAEEDRRAALLTGLKLNRARAWLVERQHQLSSEERAFVQTSIENTEAEERRKLRLRRNTVMALTVASVVLLSAAVFAAWQWRDTRLNLAASHLVLGKSAIEQGRITDGVQWYWRAYDGLTNPVQLDDPRRFSARSLISSWAASLGRPLPHEGEVRALAFSSDGSLLATGSDDRTARVWDTASGAPRGEIMRHGDGINAVAFSPDDSILATASADNTVILWDAASGKQRGEPLRHGGIVSTLAFSPNGSILATGSTDNNLRLWDVASGNLRGEPLLHDPVDERTFYIMKLAFSPDGTTLATASLNSARLWNAESGQPLGELMQHEGVIQAVAFSSNGRMLATASADETARLWDATDGRPLSDPMMHNDVVGDVAFSPIGSILATRTWNRRVAIWDAANGQPRNITNMLHPEQVNDMAFSSDGKLLVTAGKDGNARMWRVDNGQPLGEPMLHGNAVSAVAFSPEGSLIASGSKDGRARLWDAVRSEQLSKPVERFVPVDGIWSVAFSLDLSLLAIGSGDGKVHVWDFESRQLHGKPITHGENFVTAVAFSADSDILATGGWDKAARLWDVASGQPLGEPMLHDNGLNAVALSPDGSMLATGGLYGKVRIWQAASELLRGKSLLHDGKVNAVIFSPDGSVLATASDDLTARLWDVSSGLSRALRHEGAVKAVAFSPDGSILATVSDDKKARLWNVASGQPLGEPMVHDSNVGDVEFSPDGGVLVTVSDYRTRLWDVESGQPLGKPIPYSTRVVAASFGPDDNLFATLGFDGGLHLRSLIPPAVEASERLRLSVELITGTRFDTQGVLRLLTNQEQVNNLEQLTRQGGPAFVRDWHYLAPHDRKVLEAERNSRMHKRQ
jgi:WD40 repeat protein